MKRISFKDSGGLNLTQAVLDGRKTMTRRVVGESMWDKWSNYDDFCSSVSIGDISPSRQYYDYEEFFRDNSPYKVGDVVAIQQAYNTFSSIRDVRAVRAAFEHTAGYTNKMFVKAKFMLHHIRITDVRVEWLQDISDEDCPREGVSPVWDVATEPHQINGYYFAGAYSVYDTPSKAFTALIDKVSGRGTWDSNPLVWVYSFELVD